MICHNHTIENEKNQRKCHTRRIFCYENGKRVANRQNDLQPFSIIMCYFHGEITRQKSFSALPYGSRHTGHLRCNGFPRDFFQRSHIGKKTTAGIAVIQALLLRHIAKNTAKGNTRCGLAAPQNLPGIRSKSTCDNVN